ncbi:iron (metal) dependent repressor, DtxR family [Salegentibacter echinorum]|uniref:Transcriptional regulator MntR n=1 Tax=Salegentibacter echinorum TaxID=1073325 RepID=A0A1M5M404_SALEC|nr:iron (metal) dependent repressor, DtxR family [Salegentibacter echinorum]
MIDPNNMFSQSEENYLKTILHLQLELKGGVSTSNLAESLDTRAASVTEMIKRLAAKKLVNHERYYGVKLTNLGKKHALTIVRKHRLWESFLVKHLNFEWDEVHDIAEQLEHIKSKKLVEELDRFLGRPKFDPHGDPFQIWRAICLKLRNANFLNWKRGRRVFVKALMIPRLLSSNF